MWVTLIEQFLMLTLIVGRWLLPKGELTRDQLSQLLLVYIGESSLPWRFFSMLQLGAATRIVNFNFYHYGTNLFMMMMTQLKGKSSLLLCQSILSEGLKGLANFFADNFRLLWKVSPSVAFPMIRHLSILMWTWRSCLPSDPRSDPLCSWCTIKCCLPTRHSSGHNRVLRLV